MDFDLLNEASKGMGWQDAENNTDSSKNNTNNWINVEDRLPEEHGDYLCVVCLEDSKHIEIRTIYFCGIGKRFIYDDYTYVTHWQIMPEMPIEDQQ